MNDTHKTAPKSALPRRVGLIGFGNFGQFIAPHLRKHCVVTVYDTRQIDAEARSCSVRVGSLAEVAAQPLVIFAVPVQYLAQILADCRAFIRPDALVLDVSSVKLRPLALLEKHLPATAEIIGTHPLFGPQSGKQGLAGLNLVLCPTRTTRLEALAVFCRDVLQLNVILREPGEHDARMAYVQALTHFIGRALKGMDIPDGAQKTVAYQSLLNLKNNLGGDSWDLFLTIERENPFAADVRERFLRELQILHQLLS